MHIRLGYREKHADFQGILNLHLQLAISRVHRPRSENWHAHFLCMHAVWPETHQCLKGNLQET